MTTDPRFEAQRLARRLLVAANMMDANPLFPRGEARDDLKSDLRALSGLITSALAQPRPEQVEDEAVAWQSEKAEADAYLAALLDYSGGFYMTAVRNGLKAAIAADAVQHIERAARNLHRLALARPAPKPAGDVAKLMLAVRRAEDGAGTLSAKEAVKLRPADWHAVCDAARKLAASPAPANAAPASVVSHEPPKRETQQGLCVTHETQACASEFVTADDVGRRNLATDPMECAEPGEEDDGSLDPTEEAIRMDQRAKRPASEREGA